MEEIPVRMTVTERWRAFTREQKLAVGVLGVCGIVALVFSAIKVRQSIIRPFTTPVSQLVEIKKRLGPTEEEITEQQKRTDTDGDGLSDWDELNKYHTSPYLRDSDSDGIPDNSEIAAGSDPNCPKGKTCVGTAGGAEAPEPIRPSLSLPVAATGSFPGFANIPAREPNAVRIWLRSLGFSPAELANYTDAQLLEAYDEAVRAQSQQTATTTTQ